MTDRRDLSRRKLLWAVATAGIAASTGSGAAAMMTDSENAGATELAAGILDLASDPSWANTDSVDGSSPGTITGNEGQETVTLSVSGNPSHVWFRTMCKTCEEDETTLQVRFGIDTDGDAEIDPGGDDEWLDGFDGTADGYLSLREARERLSDGYYLGSLDPGDTWKLVVEWTTDGLVEQKLDIEFDFDFYATQTRHVMNTASVAPDWGGNCPEDCDGSTTTKTSGISWVAFCGSKPLDLSFTPRRSDDKRTLLLDTSEYTVPDSVDVIAVKYGQRIDLFSYDGQASVRAGDASPENSFTRDGGDSYEDTDWSSSNFCPDSTGCKYEFDDGRWECTDDSGEGGSPSKPDNTSDKSNKPGTPGSSHGTGGDIGGDV
ncbi:MAG: hypothetical protein ABEJ73_06940 [Haloplanus sp.]